jgi:hypothetical protein
MQTPAGTLARPGGSKSFRKGEEVSATVISSGPLILSVPGSSLEHNTRSYDRVCLLEFYRRKYAQLLGITEVAQNISNCKSDADSKVAV